MAEQDLNVAIAEVKRDVSYILGDMRDFKAQFQSIMVTRKEYEEYKTAQAKEMSAQKEAITAVAGNQNKVIWIVLTAVIGSGMAFLLVK